MAVTSYLSECDFRLAADETVESLIGVGVGTYDDSVVLDAKKRRRGGAGDVYGLELAARIEEAMRAGRIGVIASDLSGIIDAAGHGYAGPRKVDGSEACTTGE